MSCKCVEETRISGEGEMDEEEEEGGGQGHCVNM